MPRQEEQIFLHMFELTCQSPNQGEVSVESLHIIVLSFEQASLFLCLMVRILTM